MRAILAVVAASLILLPAAVAQRVSFGFVTGTGLTSSFPGFHQFTPADAYGNPDNLWEFLAGPRGLILGVQLEGRLSDRWSFEANVLSRPLNAVTRYTEFSGSAITRVQRDEFAAVRAWEFPLLLKYRLPAFGGTRLRPFAAAGPSFRTQENAGATEPSRYGITAGAGFALPLGPFRLSPTLRYTRWQGENIYPRYPTKPDQLEFLTSISYETSPENRRIAGVPLRMGGIAGLSLAHSLNSGYFEDPIVERTRYLAGLTLEFGLPGKFALEVDGIYKPLRAGSDTPNVQEPFSVLTWQFPVLAKYHWARPRWTPVVEAGPSFRLAGNLNGYDPANFGVTAGAGLETHTRGIRLGPSVRYTRWIGERTSFPTPSGYTYRVPYTNANSVELVFAVFF